MEIKKILAQSKPAASTGDYMYTVPDSKGAVISQIIVCNTGTASALFRIHIVSVTDGGALVKNANFYDVALAAKDSAIIRMSTAMSNNDQVYVYSDSADLAYSVYGVEFDQENVNVV